jgi:4-amino-4-deoxy-L-arabinose transferase-like glycosyltransferase
LHAVLHTLALPLTISYDGHEYIYMADVLLSGAFPEGWQPRIRTPGYPLALRAAFDLLGRQPMAILALGAASAVGGFLAIGSYIRRLAGPLAAGVALVVMATYPLAVAYAHGALTEIGTFFYLAILVWCLVRPAYPWWKALSLVLIVTAGYYHRQTLLPLALIAALVFAIERVGVYRERGKQLLIVAAQCAVVVAGPYLLSLPWEPYVESAAVRSYMLKLGILRQTLLPPEDPMVGEARPDYERAIAESQTAGNLYSGLRYDFIGTLADKLYGPLGDAGPTFVRLALANPGRYAKGAALTTMLFLGFRGLQSTNASAHQAVFGALANGVNHIDPGLARLDAATRERYAQRAAPGFVSGSLRALAPVYEWLVMPAVGWLFVQLLLGVALRRFDLFVLAVVPLAYLGLHVLILASEDRYAFPVYPIVLANLAELPWL